MGGHDPSARDAYRIEPLPHEMTSVRVPQVMKAQSGQSRAIQTGPARGLVEASSCDVAIVERRSLGCLEDIVVKPAAGALKYDSGTEARSQHASAP